ncbi:MAG: NAD(P)H-dependent oxidoreductase subunit E [Deltaproteobacteria bacterium]|nr:NAD(P)H-dependent oxidoreductase subunit E [Deltaproteobacteria bacterium]
MRTVFCAEDIFRITAADGASPGALSATLHDIQAACNHLPQKALDILARRTGHSLAALHGLVSFHPGLSLQRRGTHQLLVCGGADCHQPAGVALRHEVESLLGIRVGMTTQDWRLSLGSAACFGGCVDGPAMVVDGLRHRRVTAQKARPILAHFRPRGGLVALAEDPRCFPVDLVCPHCARSLKQEDQLLDGHPMVQLECTSGGRTGWIRLSSLWGDPRVVSEHPMERHGVAQFFCPHCRAELGSEWSCSGCDAPWIALALRAGGQARFCARQGCQEHLLDLGD